MIRRIATPAVPIGVGSGGIPWFRVSHGTLWQGPTIGRVSGGGEANCNMNVAAEWLDTHRHTVANRLRRIDELTGLDPQRGYDRELLGLALRVHLIIGTSDAA